MDQQFELSEIEKMEEIGSRDSRNVRQTMMKQEDKSNILKQINNTEN